MSWCCPLGFDVTIKKLSRPPYRPDRHILVLLTATAQPVIGLPVTASNWVNALWPATYERRGVARPHRPMRIVEGQPMAGSQRIHSRTFYMRAISGSSEIVRLCRLVWKSRQCWGNVLYSSFSDGLHTVLVDGRTPKSYTWVPDRSGQNAPSMSMTLSPTVPTCGERRAASGTLAILPASAARGPSGAERPRRQPAAGLGPFSSASTHDSPGRS